MMRKQIGFLAAILLLTTTASADEESYKTPANMTDADRRQLMAGSSEYEQCVLGNVSELAGEYADPRPLAEAALKSCSDVLTAFARTMAESNYHPDFSNYYIGRIRHRVAGNAVNRAMLIVSQRQGAGQSAPESE